MSKENKNPTLRMWGTIYRPTNQNKESENASNQKRNQNKESENARRETFKNEPGPEENILKTGPPQAPKRQFEKDPSAGEEGKIRKRARRRRRRDKFEKMSPQAKKSGKDLSAS